MPTVVLDHKQPHEKSGCWNRKDQGSPVAPLGDDRHDRPQDDKGQYRHRELGRTAPIIGLTVLRKSAVPRSTLGHVRFPCSCPDEIDRANRTLIFTKKGAHICASSAKGPA